MPGRVSRVASEWIAQRRYVWRPPVGRSRPVEVRIAAPKRSRKEWAFRLVITGLSVEVDRVVRGIDGIQALELALFAAGKFLASSPEFRAGQIEQWKKPIKYDTELFLPLPLQSLQGTLQSLRYYFRDRKGTRVDRAMPSNLLTVMEEVSIDLATLAAHLPITPRKRRAVGWRWR